MKKVLTLLSVCAVLFLAACNNTGTDADHDADTTVVNKVEENTTINNTENTTVSTPAEGTTTTVVTPDPGATVTVSTPAGGATITTPPQK